MPTITIDDFSPGLVTEIGEEQLPPGTAMEIRNFKLDKKGRLVTASGPVLAFKATTAGATDPVRQLFSWVNPANSVRWVFAVINQAIYGFSGTYKNDSDMTSQYASLAAWASNPRNHPSLVAWRSGVLYTSPVDSLLRFDGTSWAAVALTSGSDPSKTYLATTPSGASLEVYRERLWLLNGSKVLYSEPGYYNVFDVNGFFYVRENDGFEGRALKAFGGNLYIWKDRSLDVLVGGAPPDGGSKHEVSGEVGLIAPNSLVETERFLVWLSHLGVMRMVSGGVPENISKPIQSLFTGAYSQTQTISETWDEAAAQDELAVLGDETLVLGDELASGAVLIVLLTGSAGLQVSILEYASGAYRDGIYYLSIPVPSGTVQTFACTVDEAVPRWFEWEGEGMGGWSMCRLAGATDPAYIYAGKWTKPEIVALDAGGVLPMTAYWKSKNFDGGGGLIEKEFRRLRAVPVVAADSSSFDVGYEVNPGEGGPAKKTGKYTLTPDKTRLGKQKMEKSFPMNALGTEVAFSLETSGTLEVAALEADWLPRRMR